MANSTRVMYLFYAASILMGAGGVCTFFLPKSTGSPSFLPYVLSMIFGITATGIAAVITDVKRVDLRLNELERNRQTEREVQ